MSESFQVCETCGVKFPPSTEVTSSRVLCPACAAQRRAALKAAKGGGAPAPAAAAPAPAAARPAKPAAPAAKREAVEAAPEPAPRRQREEKEARRTQRAPHEHLDVKKMREESQAKLMKVAWTVTGALLVITAGVWFFTKSKQESRKQAIEAVVKERHDFRDKVVAADLNNEALLKALKVEINDKRGIWKGKEVENDISSGLAKINAALQTIERTKGLKEQLSGIESQLAANPPAEQLAKLFTQVRDTDLAAQATDAGGEHKTRYDSAVKNVSRAYVDALRQKATAAAGATKGEDLAPYGQLEDALRTLFDTASATNDVDGIKTYGDAYKQCIVEVTGITDKLFDDAYIEKQPWKDLLTDPPASWMEASSGTFVAKFGGGLTMSNAAGGQSGGVLYKPGNHWRDYVLELEVKLDKGTLSVFTRVGDENKLDTKLVPGFTLGTKNTKLAAEYGKATTLVVKVVGRTMTVFQDGSPREPESLALNLSRRGKPCLTVAPDTNATISRMRVRLLR